MSETEYSNTDMQAAYESGVEQGRADMEHIVTERDSLRERLTEAIEELECIVHLEYMSARKAKQHAEWMAWLREATE
jgi:hypothetical protein